MMYRLSTFVSKYAPPPLPGLYVSFQVSESAYRRDPVSKVSMLTLDMEKSIDFYQDVRRL